MPCHALSVAEASGFSIPLCVASVMGGAMFGDNLSFISDTTIACLLYTSLGKLIVDGGDLLLLHLDAFYFELDRLAGQTLGVIVLGEGQINGLLLPRLQMCIRDSPRPMQKPARMA